MRNFQLNDFATVNGRVVTVGDDGIIRMQVASGNCYDIRVVDVEESLGAEIPPTLVSTPDSDVNAQYLVARQRAEAQSFAAIRAQEDRLAAMMAGQSADTGVSLSADQAVSDSTLNAVPGFPAAPATVTL